MQTTVNRLQVTEMCSKVCQILPVGLQNGAER